MSPTKRKTPSPYRRTFDSPIKVVRRSSPLWKRNTQKKVVRWSPQPQPPLMSVAELVQNQHEKWKKDQEIHRRAANVTRRQKIQKNIKQGIYVPPEPMDKHNMQSNQTVSNFWRNAQHGLDNELAWASDDPPLHFGGKKRKMMRRLQHT